MPEAVFVCIDTTECMRNGDYPPTRLLCVQEAANVLICSKINSNPENTVGFLTMGNICVNVIESLMNDSEVLMSSMASLAISGAKVHFFSALKIAALALACRSNPRAEKRIVAFVGSPLQETEEEITKLARELRKNDIAVDIVSCGMIDRNDELLQKFINEINKGNNSHILICRRGDSILNHLYSSPILTGADGEGAYRGGGEYEMYGGGGDVLDLNMDPDLAEALRISAEEERQRIARLAANSGENQQSGAPEQASTTLPAAQAEMSDDDNMDEDEELQNAIRMSLEEGWRDLSTNQRESDPTLERPQDASAHVAPQQETQQPQQGDFENSGAPSDDAQTKEQFENEEDDSGKKKKEGEDNSSKKE